MSATATAPTAIPTICVCVSPKVVSLSEDDEAEDEVGEAEEAAVVEDPPKMPSRKGDIGWRGRGRKWE